MRILAIIVGLLLGYWIVSALLEHLQPSVKPAPKTPEDLLIIHDWHKILGVFEDASPEQITAAYKSAIGQYHPDKVAHMGIELRELAEKKSKQINAAYEYAMRLKGGRGAQQ